MWVSLGSSSMEVDLVQVNGLVSGIEEQADKQSLSPECSDVYDVFGDPEIFPRVGEQYQVEIPPLKSDFYGFQENPRQLEGTTSTLHDFRVGLPIPIIWIKDEVENNMHDPLKHVCKSIDTAKKIESSKLDCTKEIQNGLGYDKANPETEATDSTLFGKMKLGKLQNCNMQQETNIGMHENHGGKGHYLVPGSASDTWNEIEEASFILGLYIFGKNLVQVKRFIGSKNMGDILSLYYGKFYKSHRYQKWSECRKMRSRKCIYGQKIFTGPRQQELLSRLLPNKSEECCNKLLEVSKTFVEGKMLLEDYVLTLKASVGLEALVEAVGIGKGKEDLTGPTVDSVKSTQAVSVRSEIPVGKAYSMLTPAEIINVLTGDFRLSKARSSDLFWEAVWPRLLARGWHSEQPRSYNYAAACKHPLVFLVPRVNKFSRKLVKGNHYFDSVSDVLGKVASDPELIELETVADNDCTSKEGNGWTKKTKLDKENSPDRPRHCYLKIKTRNCSTDVMKFIVVDTSLAHDKVTKIREMRSLPAEVIEASTSENNSNAEGASEEQTIESDLVSTMCLDREQIDTTKASKHDIGSGVSSDMKSLENNPSKEELPMSSMGSTNLSAASKDQKTDILSNTWKRDAMKCQSIQGIVSVSDSKNVLVPVTKKRRRITACNRAKRICNTDNIFVIPRVKQEEASCLNNSKSGKNVAANIFVAPGIKQETACRFPGNSKSSKSVTGNFLVVPRVKQGNASCCPENSKSCENVTANIFVASWVKQENSSCCSDSSKSTENVAANIFVAPSVKQEKASCCSYNSKFSEKVLSEEPQENKFLASLQTQELKTLADSLSNPNSFIRIETVSAGIKDQLEKPQPRTMIDLNLPLPEIEADEPFEIGMTEMHQNKTKKESDDVSVGTMSQPVDHSGHQPDMHTRRQSTRNRPPTTRVLEAFAFGYLDRKDKRKSGDNSTSRPSRHRKMTGCSSSEAGFNEKETAIVVCNGKGSSKSNVIDTVFQSSEVEDKETKL